MPGRDEEEEDEEGEAEEEEEEEEDEEVGTEGCSTSRETRCAYHLSAPGRARDCPLAMKHAAGWLGDGHAKLSTQKNQAAVYVSGRTQYTLSLPPSLSRRG